MALWETEIQGMVRFRGGTGKGSPSVVCPCSVHDGDCRLEMNAVSQVTQCGLEKGA
jgi:hypothetical protein